MFLDVQIFLMALIFWKKEKKWESIATGNCLKNYLKQKLDYLFIITVSKLPKFEFWRTFSLVVAIVSTQTKEASETSEKVRQNSNLGNLDSVIMNK